MPTNQPTPHFIFHKFQRRLGAGQGKRPVFHIDFVGPLPFIGPAARAFKLIPALSVCTIIPSPIRQGQRARRRAGLGWGSPTRSRHARDADKATGQVRTA